MSYHLVYVTDERTPPADGPHVASNTGWYDFGTFVLDNAEAYPELAHLVEHGWLDDHTPGSLAKLRAELPRLEAQAAPVPDVASVARVLGNGLAQAVPGTTGVLVSDGEPGDDVPVEGEANESDVY